MDERDANTQVVLFWANLSSFFKKKKKPGLIYTTYIPQNKRGEIISYIRYVICSNIFTVESRLAQINLGITLKMASLNLDIERVPLSPFLFSCENSEWALR